MFFKNPKMYLVIKDEERDCIEIAELKDFSLTSSIFEPVEIRGSAMSLKKIDPDRLLKRYKIVESVSDDELIAMLEEGGRFE